MRKVRDWLLGGRTGPERTVTVPVVCFGSYDLKDRFLGDPQQVLRGPEILEIPESVFNAACRQFPTRRRTYSRAALAAVVGPLVVVLLAVLVLLAGCVDALAQSDVRKPWLAAPIAATVTVVAPSKDLPADVARREIELKQLAPLPFRELVGLIADRAGVRAVLQDRPGRVLDGDVDLEPAVPFGLSMHGTVAEVLDELARLSGYDWGWEDGTLVFYRYGDIEQRGPERIPSGVDVGVLAAVACERGEEVDDAEGTDAERRLAPGVPGELDPCGRTVASDAGAPVEGQAPAGEAEAEQTGPTAWQVNPEAHGTVEGVLRAWAERAGWQLAWESERQFKVGAAAEFPAGETEETGFLAAADALLAISPMRRTLTATAYPNKWLVVRDLGSVGQ